MSKPVAMIFSGCRLISPAPLILSPKNYHSYLYQAKGYTIFPLNIRAYPLNTGTITCSVFRQHLSQKPSSLELTVINTPCLVGMLASSPSQGKSLPGQTAPDVGSPKTHQSRSRRTDKFSGRAGMTGLACMRAVQGSTGSAIGTLCARASHVQSPEPNKPQECSVKTLSSEGRGMSRPPQAQRELVWCT